MSKQRYTTIADGGGEMMINWAEASTLPLPHDPPVDLDVTAEFNRYWESQTAEHRAAVERILTEDQDNGQSEGASK